MLQFALLLGLTICAAPAEATDAGCAEGISRLPALCGTSLVKHADEERPELPGWFNAPLKQPALWAVPAHPAQRCLQVQGSASPLQLHHTKARTQAQESTQKHRNGSGGSCLSSSSQWELAPGSHCEKQGSSTIAQMGTRWPMPGVQAVQQQQHQTT